MEKDKTEARDKMDGCLEGKAGVFLNSLNRNLNIWINVHVHVGSSQKL